MAVRINKPSIEIGGVEFQCSASSVTLEPDNNHRTYCYDGWTAKMDIELSYGVSGTWTVLDGMRDTKQTVVIIPEDGTVSADNPSATFVARIPAIPFITDAKKGEFQSFSLELEVDEEPVFATA